MTRHRILWIKNLQPIVWFLGFIYIIIFPWFGRFNHYDINPYINGNLYLDKFYDTFRKYSYAKIRAIQILTYVWYALIAKYATFKNWNENSHLLDRDEWMNEWTEGYSETFFHCIANNIIRCKALLSNCEFITK